jgi:CheY-like chemotaxis protein
VKESQACGRVLVVEDTPDLREAMALLLRSEGHEVAVAANGREALEVLGRGPAPDVALVDLLMPEMDGPSLVARIREIPALGRLRIVVVTAVASTHVTRLVRADAHIFKPFDARELLDAVRALLPGRA